MTYFVIFIFIISLVYFIVKNKKNKDSDSKLDYYENKDLSFTPNKIIENDNALNIIVPDFEERKLKATNELINSLGKAFPNDVLWRLLQDLYSEYFVRDHKIFLNTVYQQGLLLQKEKKYKQALSHYSYGLYYLMNFYQANFNPTAHFIDQVETENGLIEMAQQKFINKIELCINYQQLNINDMKENILLYVNMSTLPHLTVQDFFIQVESHIKKNYEKEQVTLQNLDNKQDFSYLSIIDIIPKLKREKKYAEAMELLKKAIASIKDEKKDVESTSTIPGYFDEVDEKKYSAYVTPPWYFYQLAVIYRKEKRYEDEVKVIEDYLSMTKDEKYRDSLVTDRLEKTKSLIEKEISRGKK